MGAITAELVDTGEKRDARGRRVKAKANPFDPEWNRYFEERALLKRLGKSTRRSGKSVVDTGPDLPGFVMA